MAVLRLLPIVTAEATLRYLEEIRRFRCGAAAGKYMLAKAGRSTATVDAAHHCHQPSSSRRQDRRWVYRGYGLPISEVISEAKSA